MTTACNHLSELLKIQEDIIKRNLDTHKWLKHIPDKEQGMTDFIETYGWIMREMYCGHMCVNRDTCLIAKEFIPGPPGGTGETRCV